MGIWQYYKQAGGFKLLIQYWKAHVLGYAFLEFILLGKSKTALEIFRLAVNNRIHEKLKRKYEYVITKKLTIPEKGKCQKSNKVWVCWFQGVENAPLLVRRCYESLCKYLRDREIVLITQDNLFNYVQFPDYILKKWEAGVITNTHFSDLLRLELLIKYGGTWIDATVLCTSGKYPKYLFDSDLFFFQKLKPGKDGDCIPLSSWFITSISNNKILIATRELLYTYWHEHDFLVDYFLFHHFMYMACEEYPEEYNKVVKFSNSIPHILSLGLFQQYDEEKYQALVDMTCFHKLSYKLNEDNIKRKGTYYSILINQ